MAPNGAHNKPFTCPGQSRRLKISCICSSYFCFVITSIFVAKGLALTISTGFKFHKSRIE